MEEMRTDQYERGKMKIGVMFIGVHGASASTFVGAYLQTRTDPNFKFGSYWCAIAGDYPKPVYNLALAGWDYRYKNIEDAIKNNQVFECRSPIPHDEVAVFNAILGPSDYAVLVENKNPTHAVREEAIEMVRTSIATFRRKHNLHRVIVINSSSPANCEGSTSDREWGSNEIYAKAAVLEGADWVEFTPSDSITSELQKLALSTGSRLAGRDGSTGQTIMKLCLRDYLKARGLRIDSWYSTNLIGNRDGLVLTNDKYNKTKLRDKLAVLSEMDGEQPNHIVEIRYVPPAGDDKESWDCVHFSGWLNTPMSLRLNWHGKDSFLAAPLLLDIISGLVHAEQIAAPAGILQSLGLCFKHPMGYPAYTFGELLDDFQRFVLDGSL